MTAGVVDATAYLAPLPRRRVRRPVRLRQSEATYPLEPTPEHLATEAHHRPDMKDPKARMPLPSVGRRQVVVREATLE